MTKFDENIIDAEIETLENENFNLGESKLYNLSFPHLSNQFWNESVMAMLKDGIIFYEKYHCC